MDFSKLMQVFSHKTKVHPIGMFTVILYAYSIGIYSTRDIEIVCHENIKFRFLLQNSKIPDHSTISRFLIKIEDLLPDLFEQFFKIILNWRIFLLISYILMELKLKHIQTNILLFGEVLLKSIMLD